MSNKEKTIHDVEINLPVASPGKDFMLKIDGKRIKGVRGVWIESTFDDATIVKIEMLANVKGRIKSKTTIIKEIEPK